MQIVLQIFKLQQWVVQMYGTAAHKISTSSNAKTAHKKRKLAKDFLFN